MSTDADKRAKKPTTSSVEVDGLTTLRSIEVEADHGEYEDNTTGSRQHQAPSKQAGRQVACHCTNLSSKPDTIAKATEGLTNNISEFRNTEMAPDFSRKK
jgi:hypothetical protein